MMSSNTQPSAVGTVLQRQVDITRSAIPCPQNIILYNKYLGEADRMDQVRGFYSYKVKSHKLYKYIVFFLLILPSPIHTLSLATNI